eukprot:4277188-Pleurochrysis_carterae.AAC.1
MQRHALAQHVQRGLQPRYRSSRRACESAMRSDGDCYAPFLIDGSDRNLDLSQHPSPGISYNSACAYHLLFLWCRLTARAPYWPDAHEHWVYASSLLVEFCDFGSMHLTLLELFLHALALAYTLTSFSFTS